MRAWRENERIDFDFRYAHDLNVARDTSQAATIRRRLRERLINTKQIVMLIRDDARAVAATPSRFFYYEVDMIRNLELPVVFANLNGIRTAESWRLPHVLTAQYSISVSFQPTIIRHALDDFIPRYWDERDVKRTPHHYKPFVYSKCGI